MMKDGTLYVEILSRLSSNVGFLGYCVQHVKMELFPDHSIQTHDSE